jgi:LytR cell envelope-related transcriptional attenuator
VDLPLQAPDSLIRPWRTAALVAGAIALVELLVLLAIGGSALAGAVSHRVQQAAVHRARATPPTTTRTVRHHQTPDAAARLPRSKTGVLVLNGNGRQGAAGVEAARVHAHGYRIHGVANAPRSDYTRSIVMYRPRFSGEGRRLGQDMRISLVTPLDGMRARQLHGAQLVLILGR